MYIYKYDIYIDDLEALSTDAIVNVGDIKSRGEAWGTTEKVK
jgi:hypothetical protein